MSITCSFLHICALHTQASQVTAATTSMRTGSDEPCPGFSSLLRFRYQDIAADGPCEARAEPPRGLVRLKTAEETDRWARRRNRVMPRQKCAI
ncbi:hypothetical protein F4821DRAFT_224139 [Hypoxylon rubiginosum]|uniref:Uncharacterized protein n=1 Tax=Hypoxylon rubiginosum TaxID=110542 RepID=A0ACC0DI95_9PEZI|nr:hypothetical protein F4821DRAFT_224139 [Hypoxylon rubiginosum]